MSFPTVSSARARRTALAFALLVAVLAWWAARADAYVYWADEGTESIHRADLNGTAIDDSFIPSGESVDGVAVDAGHIYWTDPVAGTIGRADLDGADVEPEFVTASPGIEGLAVNSEHIYWANLVTHTIGRADLDGSDPELSFLTGTGEATGVAVDASHIYWSDYEGDTIARADLDGSDRERTFVSNVIAPTSVAVDSDYVYWGGPNGIARAGIDGGYPEESWTSPAGPEVAGLALDADHLYWTDYENNRIGRADLDGSDPEPAFITGADRPDGIAVDAGTPPPPPLPSPVPGPIAIPSAPVQPSPARCVVPKLAGRSLRVARKALAHADCKLGRVTKGRRTDARSAKVVKQSPKPGKRLPKGSKVSVKLQDR